MSIQLHTLLVNDPCNDITQLIDILHQAGYEPSFERVQSAAAMHSALTTKEWDIILCDSLTAGFDAVAALKVLRETRLVIPFIILSDSVNEESAMTALKLGATDYLLKSCLMKLGATVSQALELNRLRRDRIQAEINSSRLEAIIESSDYAIFGEDLNNIVTCWNIGAERIYGYTAREMVGTSIKRLIPADRLDELNQMRTKLSGGDKVEYYETVRKTKDDRLINVSITASPIKNADGKVIGVSKITRDISTQKQSEREQARLSRLYAALSYVNQAILWAPSREELFNKIGHALVEHGGFTLAWIGWPNAQTHQLEPVAAWGDDNAYVRSIKVYTDDRPEGRGTTGTAFRTGQPKVSNDMLNDPIALPWRELAKQCGIRASAGFPIRMKGEVCGTISVYSHETGFFQEKEIKLLTEVAEDISFALDNFEREAACKQTRETLSRNEAQFRTLFEEAGIGIGIVNPTDGRILRSNRSFAEIAGYTVDELCHLTVEQTIEDYNDERRRWAQLIEEKLDRVQGEIMCRRKDGQLVNCLLTESLVRDAEGKPLILIGRVEDYAERKKLEEELEATKEQLKALVGRLDSMREAEAKRIARDLHDDLGQQLTSLNMELADLELKLSKAVAKQQEQFARMRTGVDHMIEGVQKISAKLRPGHLDVLGFTAAIDWQLKEFTRRSAIPCKITRLDEITNLSDSQTTTIFRILQEALTNVLRHAGATEVEISLEAGPDQVTLKIRDNGCGIPTTALNDPKAIGLLGMRERAKLVGGDVTITGDAGAGTTVLVTIPVHWTDPSIPT